MLKGLAAIRSAGDDIGRLYRVIIVNKDGGKTTVSTGTLEAVHEGEERISLESDLSYDNFSKPKLKTTAIKRQGDVISIHYKDGSQTLVEFKPEAAKHYWIEESITNGTVKVFCSHCQELITELDQTAISELEKELAWEQHIAGMYEGHKPFCPGKEGQ